MTQQPKVSVLISFYNLAPFVDQTMESVLAQKTDFPVEILCADDGSDDGTIEKLRGWEAAHSDTVRVFVMDRVPGKKYEGNNDAPWQAKGRMNAIRKSRRHLRYARTGGASCSRKRRTCMTQQPVSVLIRFKFGLVGDWKAGETDAEILCADDGYLELGGSDDF